MHENDGSSEDSWNHNPAERMISHRSHPGAELPESVIIAGGSGQFTDRRMMVWSRAQCQQIKRIATENLGSFLERLTFVSQTY
jgi:hypothetical protein